VTETTCFQCHRYKNCNSQVKVHNLSFHFSVRLTVLECKLISHLVVFLWQVL
jgi:hypothetical protein